MTGNPNIALLSLQDIDPLLRNGGSRAELERLQMLQTLGSRVSLINFLADEPHNRRILHQMKAAGGNVKRAGDEMVCHAALSGIRAYHEILPYGFKDINTNRPAVIKTIWKIFRI
jgi:hypothetical protein